MRNFFKTIELYQKIKSLAKERALPQEEIINSLGVVLDNKIEEIQRSKEEKSTIEMANKQKQKVFTDLDGYTQKQLINYFIELMELWRATSPAAKWQNNPLSYDSDNHVSLLSNIGIKKNEFDVFEVKVLDRPSATFFGLNDNRQTLKEYIEALIKIFDLRGDTHIEEYRTRAEEIFEFTYHKQNQERTVYHFKTLDTYIPRPTLLMVAAVTGTHCAIDKFLKKGLDVGCPDDLGHDALYYFLQRGQPYIESPEEVTVIKSKLDGTYRNGYYKNLYEKKTINESVNPGSPSQSFKL